ncbi:MAG: hypothetical protein WAU11_05955 [Ignavibacteriaceae bacterium]
MKFLINFFGFFLIVIFTSLLLVSCDDTLTVEDIDNKIIPDQNVSFSQHIYPILQVKCAFSGCHASPNASNGLDLTTWSNVTADPNIVFPGEPDLSRLIWAIEGNRPPIEPMPPVGYSRPVTTNQLKGIRTWITEGAQNN